MRETSAEMWLYFALQVQKCKSPTRAYAMENRASAQAVADKTIDPNATWLAGPRRGMWPFGLLFTEPHFALTGSMVRAADGLHCNPGDRGSDWTNGSSRV